MTMMITQFFTDDDTDDDTGDDTNDDTDDDTDDVGRGNRYSTKVPGCCCECFLRQRLTKIVSAGCEHRHLAPRGGGIF